MFITKCTMSLNSEAFWISFATLNVYPNRKIHKIINYFFCFAMDGDGSIDVQTGWA
jgi:uncharacterized protein YcgI (DUF1989 family)